MKKSPNYRRNQTGSSLFENAQTLEALSKQGNPLAFISKMIDFEMFRPILESKLQTTERKSNAGRKPVFTKEMKDIAISLLEEGYSPEQIKGRSNVEGFAMVSHETIYRWIWEDKRKKGTLYQNLRRKGKSYCKLWKFHQQLWREISNVFQQLCQ